METYDWLLKQLLQTKPLFGIQIQRLINNDNNIIPNYSSNLDFPLTCVLSHQPAGLAKGSVEKGASAKKEGLDSASNGEEKSGNGLM